MKIKNVELSILRTELGQEVIPTHGAVDKMPQLVLVSVSTHEGIDGHYISYLIPSTRLTASKLPFTSAEEGGGYPFGPDSACLERPCACSLSAKFLPRTKPGCTDLLVMSG